MNKFMVNAVRVLYYLLPLFLRKQYQDSKIVYGDIFFRGNKSIRDNLNKIKVELVSQPELLGIEYHLLTHKTELFSKVSSPKLYIDDVECRRLPLEGSLPDIKVIRLTGVNVLGGADCIITDNKMYHYELGLMQSMHDLKQPDLFKKVDNSLDGSSEYIIYSNQNDRSIQGVAISLLKEHSSNYYHCVTEVMPKLLEYVDLPQICNSNVSILVDDCMPEQCLKMIEKILLDTNFGEYEIVQVKKGEMIYCHSLVYCTPLWLSLDNTRHLPNPKYEFFMSIEGVKRVKNALSKIGSLTSDKFECKKVYLQRDNSKLRKVSNILEVERLLYKHGFDFIDPSSLNFEQQYELFSQADVVIGASGAAFTNLLFMRESSHAILLYPSAQCTNYYLFQPLADASKVDLIHLLTIPDDNSNSLHGDVTINIEELSGYLKSYL